MRQIGQLAILLAKLPAPILRTLPGVRTSCRSGRVSQGRRTNTGTVSSDPGIACPGSAYRVAGAEVGAAAGAAGGGVGGGGGGGGGALPMSSSPFTTV